MFRSDGSHGGARWGWGFGKEVTCTGCYPQPCVGPPTVDLDEDSHRAGTPALGHPLHLLGDRAAVIALHASCVTDPFLRSQSWSGACCPEKAAWFLCPLLAPSPSFSFSALPLLHPPEFLVCLLPSSLPSVARPTLDGHWPRFPVRI